MKRLTEIVLKYSKLVLFLVILIAVAGLYSIKSTFALETNLDTYMPKNHPAFIYSDKAEDMFDIRDAIMIAIENEDGIYNETTFRKIKSLTKEIQDLEVVAVKDDVVSLYTADNIQGSEEGLEIEEFFKKIPNSQEKFDLIKLFRILRFGQYNDNSMIYTRIKYNF